MFVAPTIHTMADASAVGNLMHGYIAPVIRALCVMATLACTFFLINGGIQYMTSQGNPEKLEHAKQILKNALIGLVIVLAAGTLVAILSHAYAQPVRSVTSNLPALHEIKPDNGNSGLVGVVLKAVTGILNNIIQSLAAPILAALTLFTSSTPLIADNPSVFNLWLAIVGMADALFVLVVALLGFRVMSFTTFGFEEVEIKQVLPQIGLMFLLMNSSIFIIDGLISLSNGMIHALQAGLSQSSVWDQLTKVVKESGGMGLAALLIMVAFLILTVILLVYYVGRIVTLYLGAVLAPIVIVTWLVPGFRDFAENAAKTYIATVFVLFIHVVILELAASIFAGMSVGTPNNALDPIMAMIVGLATLIALLKTQGVLMQLSYASVGPRTARKLGGQFMNGITYLGSARSAYVAKSAAHAVSRGREVPGSGQLRGSIGRSGTTVINRAPQTKRNTTVIIGESKATKAKTGTTVVAPKQTESKVAKTKEK